MPADQIQSTLPLCDLMCRVFLIPFIFCLILSSFPAVLYCSLSHSPGDRRGISSSSESFTMVSLPSDVAMQGFILAWYVTVDSFHFLCISCLFGNRCPQLCLLLVLGCVLCKSVLCEFMSVFHNYNPDCVCLCFTGDCWMSGHHVSLLTHSL